LDELSKQINFGRAEDINSIKLKAEEKSRKVKQFFFLGGGYYEKAFKNPFRSIGYNNPQNTGY
jgi:hypothetical protein